MTVLLTRLQPNLLRETLEMIDDRSHGFCIRSQCKRISLDSAHCHLFYHTCFVCPVSLAGRRVFCSLPFDDCEARSVLLGGGLLAVCLRSCSSHNLNSGFTGCSGDSRRDRYADVSRADLSEWGNESAWQKLFK